MNLFDRIPTELFSVLASPNRTLYANALDVLYTAYRENLKILEQDFYMMLRSKLEQQLADATFEGEDIDEEELRDISGRVRFLIRKLYSKGWFEKERGEDLRNILRSQGIAAACWKSFTNCATTARFGLFLCIRHLFYPESGGRQRKHL